MSALQVVIDGVLTAAELAALLFVSPVSAMEPPQASAPRAQFERLREMHLVSTTFDVRLLGSLADVRVSQRFHNTSTETVNLAGRLPPVDEYTDALRIHRQGRVIDLLQLGAGCGSEDEDGGDLQADLQATAAGRVQLAVDESIADALQLPPGENASIEMVATQSLSRMGSTYRLALPARAAVEAQALLVDQSDARFLVIVPHRAARGTTRLTLRPNGAASETIDLGPSEPSVAHIVPLANRAALRALAAGAIELETRTDDSVVWSTLPIHLRTDSSPALAGASK